MPTIEVPVHRFSTVSQRPFDEVVQQAYCEHRPSRHERSSIDAVASATTLGDLEKVVQTAVGSSDLMEFVAL